MTVFPQPIGIAATFNPKDWYEAAEMIADEGRAVYNASVKKVIRVTDIPDLLSGVRM